MEAAAIIAMIIKGIQIATQVAPIAIEAIPRIKADIEAAVLAFSGKTTLTDAERIQLDATLDILSARLHQPLSPE